MQDDDGYSANSSFDSSHGQNDAEWDQCRLAMRAERLIPESLLTSTGASFPRRCVIAGIRKSLTFAKSPDVVRLCTERAKDFPEFARARHARLIMSDEVPEVDDATLFPYCIWYPDTASEQTYAEVARKYPVLRYSVGRACAVAGYATLYRNLGLLPDVSIAEEARDNIDDGREILELIMQSPIRYAVMDDYTRTVNTDSPSIAGLNNDTAVRSSFNVTEEQDGSVQGLFATLHWDITEDGCVCEQTVEIPDPPLTSEQVPLLHSPLPRDLPQGNKDLFILMAAYEGNIDRYVRLRRPHTIQGEVYCVLRGIHHSTSFATWWSEEVERNPGRLDAELSSVRTAINARYIMSNDLSRIVKARISDIPYMIWYPQWPRELTLAELARLRPDMRRQVAHACIVADYQRVYDNLAVAPHPILYLEAKNSANPHYAADLERRAREQDVHLDRDLTIFERDEARAVVRDKEPTSTWLYGTVNAGVMLDGRDDEGAYGRGEWLSSSQVDLFMCAGKVLRERASEQDGGWMALHEPGDDDD